MHAQPTLFHAIVASIALIGALGCGPGAPSTPLTEAAQKGYLNLVQKHIAAKSDLNTPDKNGWTAVHLAVMRGDLPMVKILCTAGADPHRAGAGGKTPLDVARERRQTAIAQFLQSQPQSTANSRNSGGRHALVDVVPGGSGVLYSH